MTNQTVPRLNTALSGPLKQIEKTIITHQDKIEQWFRAEWLKTPPPFYASVDLRNAGYKLAPVDTNLFPGGFNNLSEQMEALCVHAIQSAAERFKSSACEILIIAEDHTRNKFYWRNVLRLKHYFCKAGFETRVGSISDELTEPHILEIEAMGDLPAATVTRYPIIRKGNKLYVDGSCPCLVVVNNDMSGGVPEILDNLEQTLAPPPDLGWAKRLKSDHFAHYNNVVDEFCKTIDMDPWLLNPIFKQCGEIDFQSREGEDCLSMKVAETLLEIKAKYNEYGIDDEPIVFVKADAGTYGMNIMVVRSPDEVKDLNRKKRNKMAKGKDGQQVSNVLVQEGVYTYETWGKDNSVAEPVVYMIDHFVVGGFYRVHTNKGIDDNLNAPGAFFEPLAFAEDCVRTEQDNDPDCPPNRFYTYGVVARLALLAAGRERAEVMK